jgi:hypothetical protein
MIECPAPGPGRLLVRISLDEFQAAHERIFKAMDTDKDGTVTQEEMLDFMRGTAKSGLPR